MLPERFAKPDDRSMATERPAISRTTSSRKLSSPVV